MGITCVSEFPCAPGRIDELIAIFHEILPFARKIGCEKSYFSISDTNPNLAVTFEIWSSKKDHELYLSELLTVEDYRPFALSKWFSEVYFF